MTQKERVLAMLEAAGEHGITSNEFYSARLPRFSARLLELRDDGFVIKTTQETVNNFRYTLIKTAGVGSDRRAPAAIQSPPSDHAGSQDRDDQTQPQRLFPVEDRRPRSAYEGAA